MDASLQDYIEELYDSGRPMSWGTLALCAVLFYRPDMKGRLGLAARALKGWRRLSPALSKPPMSRDVARVVAMKLARGGRASMGVAVLVAHHCYLRVSEYCGLWRSDVAMAGEPGTGLDAIMALRLRSTKTGKNQHVTVSDPLVAAVLTALIQREDARRSFRSHGRDYELFDFTTREFRIAFLRTLVTLDMGHLGFNTHSLRHGGATHDYLAGRSIESVLLRGRWASTKSARIYIQEGRARLIATKIPQRWLEWSKEMASAYGWVFLHLIREEST